MAKEQTPLSKYNVIVLSRGGAIPIGKVNYTVYGSGEHKSVVESEGRSKFTDPDSQFDEHTISTIGSVTKQITAATLMKLWDNELTAAKVESTESSTTSQKWFPEGIDTPLEYFMPALKEHFAGQGCDNLFASIEIDIATQNRKNNPITLRHLLNHTHGLGSRNDVDTFNVIRESKGNPVELVDIARTTEKRKDEKFGEMMYGNFGYDLVAMIIESVTKKPFDEVVKEQVLSTGLTPDTHPHSDNQSLYKTKVNIARGYAQDGPGFRSDAPEAELEELGFNTTTTSRAAGGFKSTVADLANWAGLYMGGKLFNRPQVKETVSNAVEAAWSGKYIGDSYNLGIYKCSGDKVGHGGNDYIYKSLLAYDPETQDVEVMLEVMENLSSYVLNKTFEKIYPGDTEKLRKFNETMLALFDEADRPPFASTGWKNGVATASKIEPEGAEAAKRYEELYVYILENYSPQELVERREDIIREIPEKFKICQPETLDFATATAISFELKEEARKLGADISLNISIVNSDEEIRKNPRFPPLATGAKVGLVYPSMQQKFFFGENEEERAKILAEYEYSRQQEEIKEYGFIPYLPKGSVNPPIDGNRWSNTPEERARHIINMLNDPTIDAIVAEGGGEGAIDVVVLLSEYEKDPKATEQKIIDAWIKDHPGQVLPKDFFTPRLPVEYYKDSAGKIHGLPKRGIPICGMSDISGVNNLLGQLGVARPYYYGTEEGPQSIIKFWSEEELEVEYNGLKRANGIDLPDETLPVYATVLGWMSSSAGTDFQFHLETPSILAIESIEDPENMGRILLQAYATGMLDNVKAIVIGNSGFGNTIDPEKLEEGTLVEFIKTANVPILCAQDCDPFGHGGNFVSKPFANFALANLESDITGRVTLRIGGHAPQEILDQYWENRYELEKQSEEEIGVSKEVDNENVIIIDWRTLRYSNGTNDQINTKGKTCIICADDINFFLHQVLVEGNSSGSLLNAKEVIIALPSEKNVEGQEVEYSETAVLTKMIEDAATRYSIPVNVIYDDHLSHIKGVHYSFDDVNTKLAFIDQKCGRRHFPEHNDSSQMSECLNWRILEANESSLGQLSPDAAQCQIHHHALDI